MLYLNDNGRAVCAEHAGDALAASIKHAPAAQFHETPLGSWEAFDATDIRLFGDDICCDSCAAKAAA